MIAGVMRLLNRSLKKRPVMTNVVVYAGFYSSAEFSQQTINKYFTVEKPDYDLTGAIRIVGVGSTLYPPILYLWYKFLDRKFPGRCPRTVFKKVICEQFFMTPILLAIFYTALAILERRDDLFEELRQKYLKTLLANQTFWIPGQTINFAMVPSHLRVVYVACLSFMWINILCFIKRQKVAAVPVEIEENKIKLK